MTRYTARFNTSIEVSVDVEADNEEEAADLAWEKAEEYLQTLGNHRDIRVGATLDGVGADEVEERSR